MLIHYGADVQFDGKVITHKDNVIEDFTHRRWVGISAQCVRKAAHKIITRIIRKYMQDQGLE